MFIDSTESEPKLRRNRRRDEENARTLRELGWRVCVVWDCERKTRGSSLNG